MKAEWTNRDSLSIETTGQNSILVINVPEDFDYRRCSIGGDGNIYYERKSEQRVSIIGNIKNLKPLPEPKDIGYPNEDYDVGFGDGWDACLKEITE